MSDRERIELVAGVGGIVFLLGLLVAAAAGVALVVLEHGLLWAAVAGGGLLAILGLAVVLAAGDRSRKERQR